MFDCIGVCDGSAELDECGVCVGDVAIYECGCTDIPEGECDCAGNVDLGCGCGSTAVVDECGVCGGDGPADGFDCDGESLSLFNGLIPEDFSISNIYPNPFNPITNITYGLPEYTKVNIIIYDLSGKQVQSLVNGIQGPGYHSVDWNADNYSSGMYLVRMYTHGSTFGEYVSTQKILLIK